MSKASRREKAVQSVAEEKSDDTEALIEDFVKRVRDLPQVRRVLVERARRFPKIYTVIQAEGSDLERRRPVYDAELAAMDMHPGVLVDWDMVDLADYRSVSLEQILPADLQTRLER